LNWIRKAVSQGDPEAREVLPEIANSIKGATLEIFECADWCFLAKREDFIHGLREGKRGVIPPSPSITISRSNHSPSPTNVSESSSVRFIDSNGSTIFFLGF